jgi:hypothetical protein
MFQTFTGSFAGHFHQPQHRYFGNVGFRVVFFKMPLERLQNLFFMILALHIDKIDNNDAAEVSEPELPGNGLRRFKIGFKDSLFEVTAADIAAGIHVDCGHRFGLIEHQMPARFQVDFAL